MPLCRAPYYCPGTAAYWQAVLQSGHATTSDAARLHRAIETDDVERVLADIDTDYSNYVVEIVRHSVLLVFGAPCQLRSLTGQEHGRIIPLADNGSQKSKF
jgi:hypothetical protein